MGLKAALFVLTAGFGAYYAYSVTDSVSGNDPTTTTTGAAHPSASGSENLPDPQPQPLLSAFRAEHIAAAPPKPVPAPPKPVPVHRPSAPPPWSHWLEAHGMD